MPQPHELAEAYLEIAHRDPPQVEWIAKLQELCERARDGGAAAWECFFKGRIQQEKEQHQDAHAQFEEALRTDPDHAFALFSKGASLSRLGRSEDAIEVYDDVVSRFGASEETPLSEHVGKALFNKGATLAQLGRSENAIEVYDDVVSRFRPSQSIRLQQIVAGALVNKGVSLWKLGRPGDALQVFEDAVSRFGKSQDIPIQRTAATALFNKGFTLGELGRPKHAIHAYNEVVSRFGDSTVSTFRELVVRALAYKAELLGAEGKKDDAGACLEDARRRDPDNVHVRRAHALLLDRDDEAEAAAKAAARRSAVEVAGEDHRKQIETYLRFVIERFGDKKESYFEKMKQRQGRVERFLEPKGAFDVDQSVLMVLREWNSYTPAIPDESEADRGGGYFIWHRGQGIVIDPGFDFLVNFQQAGGRIHDVDHVIVTHAHNDHTADLESVLNLLFNYNKEREREGRRDLCKRVKLYLSAGAQRKFSGLIPLRDADYIDQIATLNPARKDRPQVIPLFTGATLTVLPAYHDDVVTPDTAVGLGFDFRFRGKDTPTRRVVFTGDTGLYPRRRDEQGDYRKDDDAVDAREEVALYRCYPKRFAEPGQTDLLVAHIGSIRQEEFKEDLTAWDPQREPTFYQDHLGLLGTLILLDQLAPRAAIVSEFGEELKDIKVALVDEIDKALGDRKQDDGEPLFRVFPGDLTIVYDIKQGKFLCHNTHEFEAPEDLVIKRGPEYGADGQVRAGVFRPYLLTPGALEGIDLPEDALRTYFQKRAAGTLPHFARKPDPPTGSEPA